MRRGRSKSTLAFIEASTKKGDRQHRWLIEQYGSKAWGLEVMPSNALRDHVEGTLKKVLDIPAWNRAIEAEKAEVQSMREFYRQSQEAAG